MKTLTAILLLVSSVCFGKNFYISNTGSDLNTAVQAQNSGTPWQTIGKMNANFSLVAAGDSILFKCGDVFYGTLVIGKSGSAGNPIVIGSYSTGAKPLFSGFTTLTGWASIGGNIWQCTPSIALKATCNVLTIDGVAFDLGRTPNAAAPWYVYQAATGTTLSSNALTGTPSYVGAEIVIKKNSFTIVRSKITAQTGGDVTYAPVVGIDNNNPVTASNGKTGFGFFLQRFASSLDQQGEWFFDPSINKLKLYSTTNPSGFTIKASAIDTLLIIGKQTNIIVTNLAFEGASMYAVESNLGAGITVKNCDYNNNTRAIYVWNSDDALVDQNTINNSFNNAILVVNRQRKRIDITNNYITNTGKLVGIGTFNSNYNLKAIVGTTDTSQSGNHVNITGNTVLHTGYMGIEFQGSPVLVKDNYVRYYDSTLDDGGGIYNFNSIPATNMHWYNRTVTQNIVGDAIGAWMGTDRAGTALPDVAAIYYDEQAEHINTTKNTIFNIPGNGIQMNAPQYITIDSNLFYNCDYSILLAKKAVREVVGVRIKNNVIYQKTATQRNFFHINADLSRPSTMTLDQSFTNLWDMDSNYISNLKTAGYGGYYSATGATTVFPPDFNLAKWRTVYGHDVNSKLPPITLTSSNVRLVINPSDTVLVASFQDTSMISPDSIIYNNRANVARRSSGLFIYNGAAVSANLPPTARAGFDVFLTLPVNSVLITGEGTDTDGSISTYEWKYGATVVGTTANLNLTGLTAGIYDYTLTVTDDDGATASDTVRVTVWPAIGAQPGFMLHGYKIIQ